jgi:hypothetical protein
MWHAAQQQTRHDALPASARRLPNVVAHRGHHYHVHESLLATRADGTVLARLCSQCLGALQKAKVPEFGIANGKDFGRIDALRFQLVVKFVGSTDNRGGATSVRGHVIAFGHNGKHALEGVTTVLPRRNLQGHLEVAFVGEATSRAAYVTNAPRRSTRVVTAPRSNVHEPKDDDELAIARSLPPLDIFHSSDHYGSVRRE